MIDALDGKVIWSREYVETRFKWKKRDPLWILALRVHRLHEPIAIPYRDAYGGCTSWVELDGLPDDPESLPSELVLSDVAFEAKLKGGGRDPRRFHPPTVEPPALGPRRAPRTRGSRGCFRGVSGLKQANCSDSISSSTSSGSRSGSSRSKYHCVRLSPT